MLWRIQLLVIYTFSFDLSEEYFQFQWLTLILQLWLETHFDITVKNNNVSFEG